MNLSAWALRHHVGNDALADLRREIEGNVKNTESAIQLSEAGVSSRVRLEASQRGMHLFRNNVGAGYMQDGSFLRFGLANDSAPLNKRLKSADLIGIRAVLVTPAMVGTHLGQFVSRECKESGWHYTGTEREVAQSTWAMLINSLGGDASFCTGVGTL